jgi:uncharacterized small protein (TIGR04563 family)
VDGQVPRIGRGQVRQGASERSPTKTRGLVEIVALRDYAATEASMSHTDKRKQSLYFPEEMLQEIQREAGRLDRSLSWIVQQCWKISRSKLKEFPSSTDEPGALPDPLEE